MLEFFAPGIEPLITEIDAPQESCPRVGSLGHRYCASAICPHRFYCLNRSISRRRVRLHGTATYTADATILIDPRRVQLFQGAAFAEGQIDTPALESQIELVKSEPVALRVIKQLRLADDAAFLRSDAGLAGALRSALHFFSFNEPSEPKPLSEFEATGSALGVLAKNLTVNRVGLSYNLAIKYRALSPDQAAQIANAIADSYMPSSSKESTSPQSVPLDGCKGASRS